MAGSFPGTPANPVKVQTSLFERVLRSTEYWVGLSSNFGEPLVPHLESAAGELVADTYINEQRIYPASYRPLLTGEDQDPNLQEAQRFVVLKKHETEGWAELFATGANVYRYGRISPRLPIESIFAELFLDSGQTVGSVEISRLASRYPVNTTIQHAGFICLMRTSFALALEVGAPYIYAATEDFVLEAAGDYNLPVEVLGPPKKIQEGREELTTLLPVRFNIGAISSMRSPEHPLIEYYLKDIEYHNGLGFFDKDLIATNDDPCITEPSYPSPLYPDL